MTHAFGSIDELGEGYGFRKVRRALGVEAFGVNVIVMPPGYPGTRHYHDDQDELYFVHSGTARVEVGGEERVLGPGGMVHVSSTTERCVSNCGDDDLVGKPWAKENRLLGPDDLRALFPVPVRVHNLGMTLVATT